MKLFNQSNLAKLELMRLYNRFNSNDHSTENYVNYDDLDFLKKVVK